MKADRWKKIEMLCHEAMTLEAEDRLAFLQHSCTGDRELLSEVVSLLEQLDSAWLESPLVQLKSSFVFSDDRTLSEKKIGPYRIIRAIASGGMGQVYLAVRDDDVFERFVALKVIRKGWGSDDVLDRFYGERQILASLNHPNIARLFDGGTTGDGLPWFAMEYVEGMPVTDYCRQHNSSIQERLHFFLQVCSAVQYAHQNLIVHRDLKPANILITPEGEPKLLDFGIAKWIDLEQDPGQTQYQNRIMTPEYASPEQVRSGSITTVSDVYTLGVLLYELLTETLPYQFENRTPAQIEQTICHEEPEKPSTVSGSRSLKGDLDNIIMRALKKDPPERYSSVEQLADDIRRYQKGLPVIAREDSFAYRSQKFLQRHAWSVAVSAVIGLLLMAFAVTTYLQSEAIEARAIEAENQRDRAEQVSDFLSGLFESADPSEARDPSITALELLDRGAERAENELEDQPNLQSELFLVISDVYDSMGLYRKAEVLARKAYDLRIGLYGSRHAEVATALNALGWLRYQQGDYEAADTLLQSALVMRRTLFGEQHKDVARTLNDLAVLKQARGDYPATDTLLSQALEIRRTILGSKHNSVAVTLSNYAALKWRMGDLDTAEAYMQQALEILQSNMGNENLRVSTAMTNLAAIRLTKGDLDGAEPLYRKALEIRYKLVGDEHPDVASSLEHLGNLLRLKGAYEEAEELLIKALKLRQKLLGEDHILVGNGKRVLGYLYEKAGKYAEAEQYYSGALSIFRAKFPQGHARTAEVLHNLGTLYMEEENPQRAVPVLREALEMRKTIFGENDTRTADSMIKLGTGLTELGNADEAKSLLISGLKILNHLKSSPNPLKDEAEKALAKL